MIGSYRNIPYSFEAFRIWSLIDWSGLYGTYLFINQFLIAPTNMKFSVFQIFEDMMAILKKYETTQVPPSNLERDRTGFPENNNGIWSPWKDQSCVRRIVRFCFLSWCNYEDALVHQLYFIYFLHTQGQFGNPCTCEDYLNKRVAFAAVEATAVADEN